MRFYQIWSFTVEEPEIWWFHRPPGTVLYHSSVPWPRPSFCDSLPLKTNFFCLVRDLLVSAMDSWSPLCIFIYLLKPQLRISELCFMTLSWLPIQPLQVMQYLFQLSFVFLTGNLLARLFCSCNSSYITMSLTDYSKCIAACDVVHKTFRSM